MSYCLNPLCRNPQNLDDADFCRSCGSTLRLQNRYLALKPIGQGGFGRTFLAVDEAEPLKPRCAIKQFFPQQQGTDNLEKASELFRQEALRLEELGRHPQIPGLLAYFEQEGYQYLLQEFIDGFSLERELAEEGAFNEKQIRQLLDDLLPVLQFVHEHQVIHRDIKPTNIIRRTVDRKLFLVDLGAAKYATGTALARTGTAIGSAEYAAPEQARGKAVFSSDIYSLGATCIHLLTDMSPFDLFDSSEDRWVWRDYLSHPVSNSLGHILDKMLQSATKRRYQSVGEVLADLNAATSTPLQKCVEESKYSDGSQAAPELKLKENWTIADLRFEAGGAIAVPNSSEELSIDRSANSQVTSSENEKKGLRTINVDFAPVFIGSFLVFISFAVALVGFAGFAGFVAFNGSVRQLTSMSPVTNSIPQNIPNDYPKPVSISMSPDGQTLASSSDAEDITLWNFHTGAFVRTLHGHSIKASSIAISPDGKFLASGGGVTGKYEGKVELWNLQTGELVRTLSGHSSPVTSVTISPDGETLISGDHFDKIKLWDFRTGKLIRTLSGPSRPVTSVTVSPDGETLASSYPAYSAGFIGGTVKLWNLYTGKLVHTLGKHSGQVNSVAISLNGQILVSGGGNDDPSDNVHGGTVDVWDLRTGKLIRTLSGHSHQVYSVAISPDGQTLASGSSDGTIKLWNLRTGDLISTIHYSGTTVHSLKISPDGQTLVSSSSNGTIMVWSLLTGNLRHILDFRT